MMRVYRVAIDGQLRHVVEEDGGLRLLDGHLFDGWRAGREVRADLAAAVAPVIPGKVVGIGRNYRDHAAERAKPVPSEPLVFLKPSTAVIGPGDAIELPADVGRVDHEAELGLVIGRKARHVQPGNAMDFVLGLTGINDVTARGLQDRGFQFSHAKGFDTFAPIGPCILLDRDWRGRLVEGIVNGDVRQRSTTDELIFPAEALIAYVSAIMTLMPGDVIATGTPAGVAPLQAGDVVTVRVSGVGELTNPVR